MIGDGHDDDGDIGISSQYRKTDCGNNSEEGIWRGTGMGLSGRRVGCYMYLADKGVRDEVAGNSIGVCSRDTDIMFLYRRREY